ncbi:MAG: enoyl-CoA hydratase/isomerase family protein [Burkholderiales bacterium]|nr:enoyl-CoA hydratase/isomerase family protein [Burkholderiales bacterium]
MTQSAESHGSVGLSYDGAVATLTLQRPGVYNAIDLEMAKALRAAVVAVAGDDATSVLVIRGAGRGFCAGGDVAHFAERLDDVETAVEHFLVEFHAFLSVLHDMPKVVITSVHGAAAGAGFSLAAAGDLCIASDDARFVAAYAKLGVSPDCGGSAGVVRAVGVRAAMEMFLLDDETSAAEACRKGLVSRVVPLAQLQEATSAVARRIAAFPIEASGATKRLLLQSPTTSLETQLACEMRALVRCMKTPQYREAAARFLPARGAA